VELKLEGAFMIIKANGLKKINSAIAVRYYLTQKAVRARKIETLLRKEKHEATFATLESSLVLNKMITHARTRKSNAFFRFTIAVKANVLPIRANIQQLYHQPQTNCQKYNRDAEPTFADILNGCIGNMMEMTTCHTKVVGLIRRAIGEHKEERLVSKISDNTIIR
jgi:hypothetical protein